MLTDPAIVIARLERMAAVFAKGTQWRGLCWEAMKHIEETAVLNLLIKRYGPAEEDLVFPGPVVDADYQARRFFAPLVPNGTPDIPRALFASLLADIVRTEGSAAWE